MSLRTLWSGKGPSGFGYASTAEEVTADLSLHGKTYLVTGCNSGLGLETMRVLRLRGAHVVGTARTEEKARAAGADTPAACELSDAKSVRDCIAFVKDKGLRLNGVLCNAGIMALPALEQAYGIELQFFTNHVAHFMLVNGLLDSLTDDGRVVVTSSELHTMAPKGGIAFDDLAGSKNYSPLGAYGQSKLANILFAKELSKRLRGTRKTANALHPGVIRTNLARSGSPFMRLALSIAAPLFLKTAAQGAATQVYLAVHPSLMQTTGEYFADCNIAKPRADANDPQLAVRLWEATERIVAGLPQ